MQPNDYTSAFANIPSPNDSFMKGVQNGAALQQLQAQRQQQAAAQQQAQQMNSDLAALSQNPTSEAIGKMSIKYPHLSEQFKRSFDILDPVQKQARLSQAGQVYAALHSGAPDVAQRLLKEQAAAARNSGLEQEAKEAETMASLIEAHPEFAKTSAGLMISAAMGPEKFASTFKTLGEEGRAAEQAPFDLDKKKADASAAKSDAETKAVAAKYADSNALLDQQKKGWDIKKIAADINFQKESNRIAAMNAAYNREGNDLKRRELKLKIDDAVTARDDKVREKVAKAESGISAMDNMLNTVARLKKNPSLKDVVGSIEGRLPSLISDEGADAIALFDTLGSQAFLSQVPTVQGMGSLSNAEGEKLQSALQNLSRAQSEKQVNANLTEVERLVNKARANVSSRYGVPLRAPDTPASAPAAAPAPRPAAAAPIEVDF
jgi:hypothetical protein